MRAKRIFECRDVYGRLHGEDAAAARSVSTIRPVTYLGTTLISLLQRAAIIRPQHGLIFRDPASESGFDRLSYSELLEHSMSKSSTLLKEGIVNSDQPIVLYFDRYQDSIVWYWSVVAAGGTPALLPPPKGGNEAWMRELDHVSQLLGHPNILTTKSTAATFTSHGGFKVTCVDDLARREDLKEVRQRLTLKVDEVVTNQQDTTCTILFTSGSTGPSKAVCFSHRQLMASSYLKRLANGTGPGDQFLCWISFDHSVALCELHLHAMEAGANLYMIPGSEFTHEPLQFWKVLSDHKISYTFAPNSFLASALRAHAESDSRGVPLTMYNFEALKVLFCGGEANRTMTLKAASDFLTGHGARKTAVTAVYGLSETCSALFYNRHGPAYDTQREYAFASVGVPLPTHKTRIVDKDLNPVKVGAVQLHGPTIFKGYYNNAAATASCKTADDWFDTGDLGYLDDQNNLVIVGRSKDVLVLNGQNYSCGELECAIETCSADGLEPGYTVSFSMWSDESDTEELVVLFNPANDQLQDTPSLRNIVSQITKAVVGFCNKRPYLVIPLPRSRLPRSSIGKLSRAKLKASLLAGEFEEFKLKARLSDPDCSEAERFTDPRQATIARVFEKCLRIPEAELTADLPIETLGIDSLNFLRLRSGIERAFSLTRPLSLPDIAACHTIREINALVQSAEGGEVVPYDPIKVLRSTGPKTPLILCHMGNGGFVNYMGLWPLLPDRRILALQARGIEAHQQPFESLDEMLDTYFDAIKRHQPSGPYAIFGYCFGGILAFELAKRLEAVGDAVLFCGGLDTTVDVSIMRDITVKEGEYDERHHLMQILVGTNVINHSEVPALLKQLADMPGSKVVEKALRLLSSAVVEDAGLSKTKLDAWIRISANIHDMASGYRATGSVKTFDAFYAAHPPPNADVPDAVRWRYIYVSEWKNYVKDSSNRDVCFDYADMDPEYRADRPLRLHVVSGEHDTLTAPSHVQSLGRTINDMILLREREWQGKQG